ncbi:hypothetical protein T23_07370 [Turicibacter faecis]|uniref:Uncharacterized protein n=1 Tax=Turicibacter faecis TaxID=2963365 RepID=A0ABM8IHD9_9FIRM|nr:hypothetical protein T23_07370 [Turicibacter sp. TC023]
MFGKLKKQKTKSPVEQMEQFYLNQFLNPPKPTPQGPNGMPQGGMGFNHSAGPQVSGRMVPPTGGINAMVNNGFNQGQPMMNNNFNPSQPGMSNNFNSSQPMMSHNFNQPQPMMGNNFNQPQSMMGDNFNQPQPMMSHNFNQPQSMMGNNFNQPQSMMSNNFNQPQPMMGNNFNQPQSMMGNNFNQPQPMMGNNFNQPQSMMGNNFNQPQPMMSNDSYVTSISNPSLQNTYAPLTPTSSFNEPLSSNIGAEPMNTVTFSDSASFNDFAFDSLPTQAPQDLTPSLEDLTQTNILGNQYFSNQPLTLTPDTTPTRVPGIPAQNPTQTSNGSPVVNPTPPFQDMSPSQAPQDIQSKVDNMNIRLRKVESYLGFRPETTI